MKKIFKISIIIGILLLTTACDNTVKRAERTTSLLQENITMVVNELSEIQLLESYVQEDFEATLNASKDLSVFKSENSEILQNVAKRQEHLNKLSEIISELEELNKELNTLKETKDNQINQQVLEIQNLLTPLIKDLTTYTNDYNSNITLESQTYQSISNPKTDYHSFSKVFSNVETLDKTNKMNLDALLKYFESINAKLIDFKVYLTNLTQK